jgi:cytochrome c553
MNAYKSGERDNKAMMSVARALDDEQINALAVYLGSLKRKSN